MSAFRKLQKEVLFRLKNIPPHWFNKFTIATALFFVWMLFFDRHHAFNRYKLNRQVNRLEKSKEDLIKGIAQAKIDRKDLENNKEKFAREKYYMHKDNEEVFIIEKSKKED